MQTLDDLRRAIDAVGEEPPLYGDEPLADNYARISDYHRRRANAWRAAYEWSWAVTQRHYLAVADLRNPATYQQISAERRDGWTLIAEKLR